MPAPRNRPILIVAGLVALGVLALVVVLAIASPGTVTGTAVRSPVANGTDEQQIEAAVEAFEQAWNDGDFAALSPLVCTGTQASEEFTKNEFLEARDVSGRLNLTVTDVEVDGDDATADVANDGINDQDIALVREDGTWKWCEF